ncbi:C2H2-type zinc finger transcription factor [Phycomyces blakesleeanus NRRL 1555(-)]|uniref:C2H2-type zinc finger transcription factor n=1 Tax=Phycomyces blakesleeanus (strain ATCC 8743b / DSM 1359 / FGSC 10004 / NBRC 33097 / NRRL 1555) TaxID=763407 RepID=A0A162Y3L9_PHYB8|nr:C2H2-type zinc finger transcription factor [Phycomyces blakesleeanus NRRL 1555(-)]OAD78115.1 C2H2-type zinc finger transcription factor [Phycomyces blakesleeanus NRRL 1555(-)]|eukprot:XP_018296155.1 C2H2-type zinc finger transcription factor [Phycomyces blakesleeanus NRRL 1555(-)]
MSFSNTNQQGDRLSTEKYQCAQCVLSFYNYQQLQNHKRVHRDDHITVAVIDQFILHDVKIQHDGNSIIDDNELVSDSDNNNQYYAMNTMEIDEIISYKCGCSFEDSEGKAHVYNSSQIGGNTFTKAKLMSIHLSQLMLQHRISRAAYRYIVQFVNTISHGKTVNALLKSKSSVKGHEYDVCPSGCQFYGINDNQESCIDCSKLLYKTDPEQSETSSTSMKLMSLTNIFDGDSYKQLVQQGLFSNSDDIAIELYTDSFINQKKGKSSYNIVHAVLAILPGPKKPTHLDTFLTPIIIEIKDLEVHGLVIKSNGVEVCCAKIHLLLASGDIPAVADMAYIGSHASLFDFQICETKGKAPDNRWHEMYFEDSSAPLRPLEDFKTSNPIIARGIGKHIYNLITVSLTKETNIFISIRMIPSPPHNTHSSYQELIDGTCVVDWLDFLLYIVLTLVVPFLPNRAVKTAVLSLVKCCALTLQWMLTSELLDEIDVIQNEIDLIQPKPYGIESYMDLPNDPSGAQLWEPFHRFAHLNNDLVEDVTSPSVKDALTRYYQQTSVSSKCIKVTIGDSTIVVASHLWMNSTVNHNIIAYSWLVGVAIFFFQLEDSLGSLRFLAFVDVMKEHDAAAHDSSVPIVKQRSQNSATGR